MLADKQVLARILKYSLDEFKDDFIDEIIRYISDDIEISTIPVDPGLTNLNKVSVEVIRGRYCAGRRKGDI